MVIKRVWQCGHCGNVYKDKVLAEECCGYFEEESWQCENCKILYNTKPDGECDECGGK